MPPAAPFLSRQEMGERNGRGEDSDFFPPDPLFETGQGERPLANPPGSESCGTLPQKELAAESLPLEGKVASAARRMRWKIEGLRGTSYNTKHPLAPSGRHPKGVPLAELSPQATEGLKM